MATPVGLEPTTPGLEVQCSNPTELRGHRISILANSWRLTDLSLTLCLEGRRSIQLSYGRVRCIDSKIFASRATPFYTGCRWQSLRGATAFGSFVAARIGTTVEWLANWEESVAITNHNQQPFPLFFSIDCTGLDQCTDW